ncbi:MAG: hypothetical protein ACOY3I_04980 [Verrucomicrobiota bacterium]
MNNYEAKLILQAYRPSGRDAQDPHFREALAQAEQDPSLGAWFAEEQKAHAIVSKKLRAFPVPEDVKVEILVGRKIDRVPLRRHSHILVAMVACAVMGLFTALYFNSSRTISLNYLQKEIAIFTEKHEFNPPYWTEDSEKIRAWLKTRQGSPEFVVPVGMQSLANIGCEVREFHGRKVSVICFWVDKNKREAIHLFVVDRSTLKDLPLRPMFLQQGKAITAAWSDDKHAYILSGIGDATYLSRFL